MIPLWSFAQQVLSHRKLITESCNAYSLCLFDQYQVIQCLHTLVHELSVQMDDLCEKLSLRYCQICRRDIMQVS